MPTARSPQGLPSGAWQRLDARALEIMAISGHKSLAEVERYIRSAEQAKMADRAIARRQKPNYPRSDQSYPREKKG